MGVVDYYPTPHAVIYIMSPEQTSAVTAHN